jgi:hypothetical protein
VKSKQRQEGKPWYESKQRREWEVDKNVDSRTITWDVVVSRRGVREVTRSGDGTELPKNFNASRLLPAAPHELASATCLARPAPSKCSLRTLYRMKHYSCFITKAESGFVRTINPTRLTSRHFSSPFQINIRVLPASNEQQKFEAFWSSFRRQGSNWEAMRNLTGSRGLLPMGKAWTVCGHFFVSHSRYFLDLTLFLISFTIAYPRLISWGPCGYFCMHDT